MFLKSAKECGLGKSSEGIRQLKVMTKAMDFSEISKNFGKTVEMKMDKGTSYMVGLMKEDVIAVARNFASKGALFPEHQHEEWEMLVVYKGVMELLVDGKLKVLNEKDFYYLLPRTRHSAKFTEECHFLAITIPGAKAWPDGE